MFYFPAISKSSELELIYIFTQVESGAVWQEIGGMGCVCGGGVGCLWE